MTENPREQKPSVLPLPKEAAELDLIVLQIKEFRTQIGSVLDDAELGNKYLIRAKRKALAVIQPFNPAMHAQAVKLTRRNFIQNTSGYFNRARQGEIFGIIRAVEREYDPKIVLERPAEEMLREPTIEEHRIAERDRKRKSRKDKRDQEWNARMKQNQKLKAVKGLSLEEIHEAVRLLKERKSSKSE